MVIYGMDFGGNSFARNRFKDIIINAHQQQKTRDLSVTELNAQRRRQPITLHRYIPVFADEIRSMMYTFGNCQEPLPQSVFLVEKILRDQMNKLLCKATEAAFIRGGYNISHEDLLFIIRKNRIVVKRLMQYLEIVDMKAVLYRRAKMNLDTAYPGHLPRGLRVKVCLAFLDYLDESGALGSVLDEYVDDPVGNERMLRRNRMTLRMSTEEYMKFSERLSASFFPGGKAEKFRVWLLEDNVTPLLPTKLAVEIINFLARETVAQIVDLSLEVKKHAYACSLAAVSNISKSIEESFEDTDGEDFQDINGEESDDSPVTDNMYLKSEAPQCIKTKVRDSGMIDMADGESDSSSDCELQEEEDNEYDENSDTETSSDEENRNEGSSDESSDELSDNHVTDDDETESEDNSSDNEDAVDDKKIIRNKDVCEDEDMSDAENISDNDEDNASNEEEMAGAENVSDSDEDNASNDEEIAGIENVPDNDEDSASSNEDIADVENVPDKDENNAFCDEDIACAENVHDNDEDNAFCDGDIADPENAHDNASNVEDIADAENVPDNDEDNASNDEEIVDAENVRDNDEDNAFNDEGIAGAENVPDNDDDNASNDEDIVGAENILDDEKDNVSNDEDIADAEDGSGDENNESSDENVSNDETASSTENSESCEEECDSEEEEAVEENKEGSDENEYEDSSEEKSEDTSEDSMNESEEDSSESSDSSQNNSKENSPEAKLSDEDFDNKGESSSLLQKENVSGKAKSPEAEDFHKTSVVPESDEVCQMEDSHHLTKTDYIFSLNEPGISDISDAECPDASQKLDVQDKQACDTRTEMSNIQEEIPVETTFHGPADVNVAVTYAKPSTEVVNKSHFAPEDSEKVSEFQGSATEKFLYETVEDFESQPYGDGEAQSVLVKPTDVDAVYEEEIQPSNPNYIPNTSAATETYEEMDASQSDSSVDASSSASEPLEEDTDSDPVPSPQTFYRQSFKPYPFTPSKFPTPVFSHDPETEDACSLEDQFCQQKLPDLEPYEREPITPYDIEEALRRFHMPVQPALFFKVNPQCRDNERLLFC